MDPSRNARADDRSSDAESAALVARWLAGDRQSERELGELLSRHARLTVRSFLSDDGAGSEDLAQDAVIAVMGFLKRRGGFTGSLVNFTIAVARNRCRNFLIWRRRHPEHSLDEIRPILAGPQPGPLAALLESEATDLLQRGLAALDRDCRELLRAFYLEERSMQEIWRRTGLKTVQSLYYRRAECLKKLGGFLKAKLADCSSSEDSQPGIGRE